MQADNLKTTSWDNSQIYKDFNDPKINSDLKFISEKIEQLKVNVLIFEALIPKIQIKSAEELYESINFTRENYKLNLDLGIMLYTLRTYTSTALSVDALNYAAKDLESKVLQLQTSLAKATKPMEVFLLRVPQDYLNKFLQDEKVEEMKFVLNYAKKEEDFLLDVQSEKLISGLSMDGLHAWGRLYDDICGSIKVKIDEKNLGLAQASNILFQDDAEKRKKAYRAINEAWSQHEISAAAILNSINGWRLENNRFRSSKSELHYLDKSCFQQKISRETLDTLMQTTFENRHIGQKALRIMSREFGQEKLNPWDILAPYPTKSKESLMPFPDAIELIIEAFNEFSKDMGDFTKTMYEKRWIDSTPTINRRSGAYCTGFASVREPRIFITYDGSMKNVITLAHELGHAYHSWVMKDLKFGQTFYPSTLAETASIFAETLVRNFIVKKCNSAADKKAVLWQEVESAASLLINIPARYEFEKQMVETRKLKALSVPELKLLTVNAWKKWYEDTLSEYNEMFWATKLHFSISSMGFYNYPYLFGYLFSLGIYAKKNQYGDNFNKLYLDVLKDTGSMTCEDLIYKHFGQDITQKDFWSDSLKIVEKSIEEYEAI